MRPLELELAEAWWESNTESSPDADERRIDRRARARASSSPTRCASPRSARRATRSPADDDPLLRRQLDVLHDALRAPPGAGRPAPRHRRARDARRVDLQQLPRPDRRPPRRRQRDRRDPAHQRRHRRRGAPRGRRRSRSGPRSPTGSASSPGSATRPRAALGYRDHFALALATGELDEDRLFATLDDVDRATAAPFADVEARARRAARDALRLSRSTSSGRGTTTTRSSRTRRPRAPSTSTTSSPTPTSRRSPSAPTTASVSTSARCSTHSDLYARDGKSQHAFCIDIDRDGRRARALQRRAERAVDGHDAPRVRARDLRPRVRPRPAVARPRRRARAHHRGHRDALRPARRATRRGCARSPASRADDVDALRRRARATRDAPRCSCSPAGCW